MSVLPCVGVIALQGSRLALLVGAWPQLMPGSGSSHYGLTGVWFGTCGLGLWLVGRWSSLFSPLSGPGGPEASGGLCELLPPNPTTKKTLGSVV